ENYSSIDFIVSGAGEAGMYHILENDLNLQKKIIQVNNPHFSKITFPYIDEDFPELNKKYVYYESSRGCPYKCSYCLSSRLDQPFEFKDFETVKKELLFLIDKKPRIIKFVDRTFNANQEFARKIWKFLIDMHPDIKFHFEVFPSLLEEEDFEILVDCPKDLFQFEIGIQSTNPTTLKEIHRPDEWQISKHKIMRIINQKNIHVHVDLIVGLPYEDFSSLKTSFNEIYSLYPDYFQLGFLKVLPGTEISERIDEYGIKTLETSPYQVLETKWLSYEELVQIQDIEKLLNFYYNSGKFKTTLENITKQFEYPFDFYLNFSLFLESQEYTSTTKDWQKNAQILIDFIKNNFSDEYNYFLDCLRWDWCYITNAHFYPEFLQNEFLKKAKKEGFEYLKQESREGQIHFNNYYFSLSDLKKAVFFIPSSKKFKKQYFKDFDIAVILKINNKKECIKFRI
ncbi:MAG: DUF4080 domain-containing protein, partial [Candidatus Cloacimonetes bacterium]|nr:DUF4080 domain-containing protein [Candidatus Cloacimonadota bacterium]